MAIQMTGGASRIIYGECDPLTLHPNLDWLQTVLRKPTPPKMVILVNPCNPTGEARNMSSQQGYAWMEEAQRGGGSQDWLVAAMSGLERISVGEC